MRHPEICKTYYSNYYSTKWEGLAVIGDDLIEKLGLFDLTQNQASVYAAIIN